MNNTYEETFRLLTRDCDLTGSWRPGAILEVMQETAGTHSLLLGCGRDALLEKGIVWVLSRCELHMSRYPKMGESVLVRTFPVAARRCFFPRYFLFMDAAGNLIGSAGTLWILLDLNTRRMLPSGAPVAGLIPDNNDLSVPMNLPATVGILQGEEFVTRLLPCYTDLDVNGHVNNTKYADWLCNALGISLMKQYEPETVLLNYNHEILPDQEVTLHRVLSGNRFRLTGFVDSAVAFDIGGNLRERS